MLLSAGTTVAMTQCCVHAEHTGESYTLVASSYNGTILLYLPLLSILSLIFWDQMLIVLSTLLCISSPGVCHVGVCTWLYVIWS